MHRKGGLSSHWTLVFLDYGACLVRFVYICVLVFMLCKRGNIKECAQNPQEANSPHVSLKQNGNDSVGQIATLTAACSAWMKK